MSQRLAAPIWLAVFIIQVPMLARYFRQLLEIPNYGWPLLAIVGTATLVLLLTRWNRRIGLPQAWHSLSLVAIGLLISAGAAYGNWTWPAMIGLLLTVAVFFASQQDGQGRSLLPLWPVLIGLVIPPLNISGELQAWLGRSAIDTSSYMMKFFRIAHIPLDSAMALPGKRIYIEQLTSGFCGWPLFLTLALLHSVVFRRQWAVVVCNACGAIIIYFVYLIGVTISLAYVQERNIAISSESLIFVAWGTIAWLLFLSLERGIRGVLFPIPDGSEDAIQANPIVIAWNLVFDRQAAARQAAAHENSVGFRIGVFVLPIAAVVAAAAQAPQLLRPVTDPTATRNSWRPNPAAVQLVWANADAVDHRRVLAAPSEWGASADVWTHYLPGRETNFVATHSPRRWLPLSALYAVKGWASVSPHEQSTVQSPNQDAARPIFVAELKRGNGYAVLCYAAIDADGRLLTAEEAAQTPCRMLQSFSTFLREPDAQTRQAVEAEFSSLCDALSLDLESQRG